MSISAEISGEMQDAIQNLKRRLQVAPLIDAGTHKVLVVNGWSETEAIESLAVYLVGLRLSMIDQAGQILAQLLGSDPADCLNITRAVSEIVDPPTDCNNVPNWKATCRNAWIAEGIWHCCMRIAMERLDIHSPGQVVAIDFSHVSPKDHGFDVLAVYKTDTGELGISFVETKAYCDRPNKAISDALSMLKEIEEGKHDTRIRQSVTSLRGSLPASLVDQIKPAMWRERRTHIPNPHYEENGANVQWNRRRSVFCDLTSPVLVMPHAVNGYVTFFGAVADGMRSVAGRWVNLV